MTKKEIQEYIDQLATLAHHKQRCAEEFESALQGEGKYGLAETADRGLCGIYDSAVTINVEGIIIALKTCPTAEKEDQCPSTTRKTQDKNN